MGLMNGGLLTAEERAELRQLIQENKINEVSDEMREFIEREMPDLAPKLPPKRQN
jgi:hypothetical protein